MTKPRHPDNHESDLMRLGNLIRLGTMTEPRHHEGFKFIGHDKNLGDLYELEEWSKEVLDSVKAKVKEAK